MRGSIGRRLSTYPIGSTTRIALFPSSSALFSTSSSSSGDGSGRGRGRGSSSFGFGPGTPDDPNPEPLDSPSPPGLGHGRGKPLPSPPPISPSFSSNVPPLVTPSPSAGRGRIGDLRPHDAPQGSKKPPPMIFRKEEVPDTAQTTQPRDPGGDREEESVGSIPQGVSEGAGRGKSVADAKPPGRGEKIEEENRHLRASSRRGRGGAASASTSQGRSAGPKMSREEAVRKAMGVLSRGGGRGGRGFEGRGGSGEGIRGRGMRGRGRGKGRPDILDFKAGTDADGERLAKFLGPERMQELNDLFERAFHIVFPSEALDEYLNDLDYQLRIECDPEWFGCDNVDNPDIDEKPIPPLRDYLNQLKPYYMAADRIKSEDWEEVLDETVNVIAPVLQGIADRYGGPQRLTAKQHQAEFERLKKTFPDDLPASVKNFVDRAVTTLHSNPMWKYGKKRQFFETLRTRTCRVYGLSPVGK